MPAEKAFGSRVSLKTQSGEFAVYHLPHLAKAGLGNIDRLPYSIRVLLEACLRNVDGFVVTEERRHATWRRGTPQPPAQAVEVPVQARPRGAAGLHRRAGRRRSGGAAKRDGPHGGRSEKDQSAGPLRSGDRPLRAGRRIRHAVALQIQRRTRNSSATWNAISSSAGANRRSTTSASFRRPPASCIR